jgi:hypothetical protein
MKIKFFLPVIALAALVVTSSCKKDKKEPEPEPETPTTPTTPSYTVPASYNFSNANFTSSTQRIEMLSEITGYIRTAHSTTTSPVLNAQRLKDMYMNANSQFTSTTLNSSGIQLKDQTSNTFTLQTILDDAFTDVGLVTQTTPTASNGTAGKLISGTKAYLVDANGFEYKETVEKGIMGGVLYYQATTILKNIATYDNNTSTSQGTAQEHAWDEAFGYFGVPLSFPTTTVGVKNWGSYCNAVNPAIGSNTLIMNAFLKGRAAISNKDNASRDAARDVIIATWEKVAAARFITYMKAAKSNIADDAVRSHNLTECIGFVNAFKYNPSKTITDTQIAQLLGYFGGNFYTMTSTNMDSAISTMASIFSLDPNTL